MANPIYLCALSEKVTRFTDPFVWILKPRYDLTGFLGRFTRHLADQAANMWVWHSNHRTFPT